MAATILDSQRAIEMSVFVVRAFIQLRDLLSSHKQLSSRLDDLERKPASHDRDITMIINAIRNLITPPSQKKRQLLCREAICNQLAVNVSAGDQNMRMECTRYRSL